MFDGKKLKEIMRQQLQRQGVCEGAVHHMPEALVMASLRGVDSHGINLFPHYCRIAETGRITKNPVFSIQNTGASTAVLDAAHGYGHHAGAEAMQHAVSLAKQSGVGAVAVKESTHFAAAFYYAFMAAKADCIGFAFTNAEASVIATNSLSPVFGTNPVCMAAPMTDEEPFCLDMATSALSINRLTNYRRTNTPVAPGLAFDPEGNPTTDPAKGRYVAPVGGYKGYGLGMMVEILCGLLSGGPVSKEITPIYADFEKHRHLGHFFMAIDIARFSDVAVFKQRLAGLAAMIRALPRADAEIPVMIPGDPEKAAYTRRMVEGIPLDDPKVDEYLALNPDFAKALL